MGPTADGNDSVLQRFTRGGSQQLSVKYRVLSVRLEASSWYADADVGVYTVMKLLGHESMTTSQRYVSGRH